MQFSLLRLNAPNSRHLVILPGIVVTVRTTPLGVDSKSCNNDGDSTSNSSNSYTLVADVEGQKLGRSAAQSRSASLPHRLYPQEL